MVPSVFSVADAFEDRERAVQSGHGKRSASVLRMYDESHFAISHPHVVSQFGELQKKIEVEVLAVRAIDDCNARVMQPRERRSHIS
jgi:hypothetical protein